MKKAELEDLIITYATIEIENWNTSDDELDMPSNTLYRALVQKDRQVKFDADVMARFRTDSQVYDKNAYDERADQDNFDSGIQWEALKKAVGFEGQAVFQQFRPALFDLAAAQGLVTAARGYSMQLEGEADSFKDLFNRDAMAKKLSEKRNRVLKMVEQLAAFGED